MAVGSGGTVIGLGAIGGGLINGGTVRPGGSIGTLSVGGNFIQSAAGTLAIEVSPAAASKLAVGGNASLAGTLALIFDPGVYTARSYTLLTAASVGGAFATVTGTNPSGLTQAVVIDPADVQLQLGNPAVPAPTVIVIAPTNDTIYTAATSIAVLNGQRANSIILDRLGNRTSGHRRRAGCRRLRRAGAVRPGRRRGAAGCGGLRPPRGHRGRLVPRHRRVYLGQRQRDRAGLYRYRRRLSRRLRPAGDWRMSISASPAVICTARSTSTRPATARSTPHASRFTAAAGGTAICSPPPPATPTIRSAPTAGLVTGTATESHGGNEATAAAQWSRPLQLGGFGGGLASLTPKAGLQFVHLSEGGFAEGGAGGFNLSSAAGAAPTAFSPISASSRSQKFVTDSGTRFTPGAAPRLCPRGAQQLAADDGDDLERRQLPGRSGSPRRAMSSPPGSGSRWRPGRRSRSTPITTARCAPATPPTRPSPPGCAGGSEIIAKIP